MIDMLALVATLCAGIFSGAAIYISVAQHPATLEAGASAGGRFFPPMYRRAAPMQVLLAVVGTVCGLLVWKARGEVLWLVGAVCLVSVIPITLVVIKPVNDKLLDPSLDLEDPGTEVLLRAWGPRHALRSVVSGAAFLVYLVALGGAG